jgi:hypothetical protein
LRWGAYHFADDGQCPELLEITKDRHCQGTPIPFVYALTLILFNQLTELFTVEKVKEMLEEIVKTCFKWAQEQQQAEGYIKLERGFATIPLPGIDVPFHSRYLWAGVMPFRACKWTNAIFEILHLTIIP